jgi:hypothetical protein
MVHRFTNARAVLRAASVTAVLAALPACSDDPVRTAREAERAPENVVAGHAGPQDRKGPAGLDSVFHDMGGRIPGFAGFYMGGDGAVNVMLVDRAQNGLARREVSERLGHTRGRALGHMNVKLVKYDFRRLYAYKQAIDASADDVGLTVSGICEERNRVCIGVRRGGGLEAARSLLARLGIPSDAVDVEEQDPVIARKLLSERFAPVPGGVMISSGCTLGYNAYYQGLRMFVTNSHCTDVFGSAQSPPLPLGQPDWNRIIGYEFNDPPTFPCSYNGRSYACRYSDAASYTYVDSVGYRLGRIARPYYTTISVDPANPEFRIINERAYPYAGETVSFVGRVSGWREGPVSHTCTDVTLHGVTMPNGTPIRLLCQDAIKVASNYGDSGAPMFYRTASATDVYLGGLLHSGTTDGYTWFSAMQNIEFRDNMGDYYTGP